MFKSQELRVRNESCLIGGGIEKIEAQHRAGKLTARERLDLLLDKDSFVEIERLARHRQAEYGLDFDAVDGDGVIAGHGKIGGRLVFVFAQDFTAIGGSLGEAAARKICKILDDAVKTGAPVIGLNDSGGARIQEGVLSLSGYGEIFYRNTQASGLIPQISVIMGPCAGGAVYSPALTDFTIMVRETSYMFVTGPEVVKAVTREEVRKEDLGGASNHEKISGQAHLVGSDDRQTLALTRKLLSYLPSNNVEDPPALENADPVDRRLDDLEALIPENPNKPYDMREVVERILDRDSFFEIQPMHAPNLIVGFGRIGGMSLGIVANQPMEFAGCLDIQASTKGARFVRFCDAFNIPILTMVDVPGFMPGVAQELGGIIRNGAKLLYSYCEATVPKVTLIVRKAYGGAYIVMNSKHIRSDRCFAFPGAEIAVMGPEGAVNIIHRRKLASCSEPDAERKRLIAEYREKFATPYKVAELGFLEEVIDPAEARIRLAQSFEMLKNKRVTRPTKKHGNMPL
ncbi:MAG TPA: acyl-CoA carboxylase subunit beta [bacterium]|nr:acyl-CoA carboxylase subunit beta [bacterium]